MKKIYKYLFVTLLLFSFNVQASTNTTSRTKDNLKIRNSIQVTDKNIDNILKTPKVSATEKVYDFANLFNDEEEISLYNVIMQYIETSNYDLVVVTINDNNKISEIEYADDFYDYNDFGFDASYSGSLLLIDMDNRVVYISTKGYAIKMYDDYRIDKIIDVGYYDLKSGLFYDCINKMILAMDDYYGIGFPKRNDNLIIDGEKAYYDFSSMSTITKIVISIIASGIISLITSLIMYFKTRLKIKTSNAASYLSSERDLQFNHQFINSTITRIRRSTDSSSSGGFGGSSMHSGSSGSSHGGGGRGF